MKYCPHCGQPMSRQRVEKEDRDRLVCGTCGRIHYENPRMLVCAIITWHGRMLMCRRAEDPARGQWSIPLGYLECGETLEQGAAREVREETGVVIDPDNLDLSSVMSMPALGQVAIVFRAELKSEPALRVGPECLEAAFMLPDEIPIDQFAWHESVGHGAREFLEELRAKRFSIQLMTIETRGGPLSRIRKYVLHTDPP